MKKILLTGLVPNCKWMVLVIMLLGAQLVLGEVIPADRRITWEGNVGVAGGIPNVTNVYTTFPTAPTQSALQTALNNCPSNQVVLCGPWTATYSSTLTMAGNGIVLRGSTNANGQPATKIIFSGGGMKMQSPSTDGSLGSLNTSVNISADASKGATTIAIASVPTWIHIGELYIIDETDDSSIHEAGQQGGMNPRQRGKAQIIKVVSKTATSITVEIPLYETYRISQTAQIAQSAYNASSGGASMKRSGIENIAFEYTWTGGSSQAEGITMANCDSCWLNNVSGYNVPGTYHVWLIFDYRCQINHSEFSYAHVYSGGEGYGITLYYYTTAGLFENNIVHHTHCGCTVNYGSSGNVFAYNYFFDGYSDQTSSKQEPSISAHGACSWQNLFEGNWCYNKVLFDYTHGTAGIHNTVARNRVMGLSVAGNDQVPISSEYTCRLNNFVGNILGVAGTQGSYMWLPPNGCSGGWPIYRFGYFINVNCDASSYDTLATGAQLIHGNHDVVNNGIVWDTTITDHAIPSSYYLPGRPTWFGNLQWPPYDSASSSRALSALSYTNIPAGYRYAFGSDPATGPVNQPPTAVATAAPMSGLPPLAVTFSSIGSSDPEGAALSYSWTFGDGGTSTSANPLHTYTTAGTYVARLTVSDGTNSTSSTALNIGVGNQPPVGAATATPAAGLAPLLVTFSSAGSADPNGTPITYNWNFGDGTTSTAANPTHTYQTAGSYLAQLTVSDGTNTSAPVTIAITPANGASGMVAAYGFEEGSGAVVTDASGKGNVGAAAGTTWTSSGRYGKALALGAGALVTVNDSATLDLTAGMTLELWVYPTNVSASWANLIMKPNGAPSDFVPSYVLNGATPNMVPSAFVSPATNNLFAPSSLPVNTWSHIAVTYDGTKMCYFLNGELGTSNLVSGAITASTDALTIGGNAYTGQNWPGRIDEVRIYNRALSTTEILTDMNTPLLGAAVAATAPSPPQGLRIVAQ